MIVITASNSINVNALVLMKTIFFMDTQIIAREGAEFKAVCGPRGLAPGPIDGDSQEIMIDVCRKATGPQEFCR